MKSLDQVLALCIFRDDNIVPRLARPGKEHTHDLDSDVIVIGNNKVNASQANRYTAPLQGLESPINISFVLGVFHQSLSGRQWYNRVTPT